MWMSHLSFWHYIHSSIVRMLHIFSNYICPQSINPFWPSPLATNLQSLCLQHMLKMDVLINGEHLRVSRVDFLIYWAPLPSNEASQEKTISFLTHSPSSNELFNLHYSCNLFRDLRAIGFKFCCIVTRKYSQIYFNLKNILNTNFVSKDMVYIIRASMAHWADCMFFGVWMECLVYIVVCQFY